MGRFGEENKNIRIHDIRMSDRRFLRDVVNAQLAVRGIDQKFNYSLRPICTVTQQPQVTERFFWTAKFPLLLAQLIGELDQEFSISVTLMLRESQDAGDVVVFSGFFLL